MSKMMDELHRIREEHHDKVKGLPLHEREHRFPATCEHCGHRLPPATRSADSPPPRETYTVVKLSESEDGQSCVTIQSPPCSSCSKTTTFRLVC